jgi:protein involved in polysaccharide export with SLBB domain
MDASRQQLPGADQSSEASAQNSLQNSANYTEAPARNRTRTNQPRGQQTSPEPLTEFQRFVAASTGELLPIYGANLFAHSNEAFGPLDRAPAPENLIVGPDDELRIRIWGQVNFSANLRVSREGEIYLPKAGAVHVGGLPVSDLSAHLRTALDRVYRNYDLSVDLGEIHSIQIYLTGRARQPGEYTVSGLSTLVDAVFLSGGPSSAGSMRHVLLRRQGKTITDFDLYNLVIDGDKSGDVQLQSGDVLFIPAAGAEVALLGSVRESAIYELRGQDTVARLLDAAGGRTALAAGARLSIERIDGAATRRALTITTDAAGLDTALAAGDIVRVDAILSSYRETVTLRGSLANPGHFRWHAGMKLSELLPDRDALVSRDYWWRRTQLGLPAPEFTLSIAALPPRSSSDRVPATLTHAQLQTDGQAQDSEAEARSGSPSAAQAPAARLPASSGRELQPTQQGAGQVASLASTDRKSQIEGEANLPRPGTQTDWNYAVIERIDPATMTPSLLSFDLGKLVLEHDPAQDLELQPGDVVTVFSQDDIHLPVERQTKYVRLEGEFAHAGVYSVQPGETLRTLVARAGGLTSKAYLYGSEFTRKSTQELEQQRLKEYADQLEHQLQRNSIAFTGESGGGAQPGQVQAIDDALVVRLRQVVASGRIVLNLRPRSQGAEALPDLALEDGDRLVIPSMPATVQVIGAVLNQHAFLHRPEAHVADYLHLAGGPNRDADRGSIFILRADGSVTSRDAHQSVFANGLDHLHLNPGDTLVVPEKSLRPSALHEISAWAQLVSGFALSSAAISAIK